MFGWLFIYLFFNITLTTFMSMGPKSKSRSLGRAGGGGGYRVANRLLAHEILLRVEILANLRFDWIRPAIDLLLL